MTRYMSWMFTLITDDIWLHRVFTMRSEIGCH